VGVSSGVLNILPCTVDNDVVVVLEGHLYTCCQHATPGCLCYCL